ncbi:MMPL family transporter [Pseudoteredinibacter isoporae]|uniref:MMPL family transporter n=1 Tax=Pseudoteredinibacter isoporae TaxID=570281 RepID=UPI003109320B
MKTSKRQQLLLVSWLVVIAASAWIVGFHIQQGNHFETNVLKLLPLDDFNPTVQAAENKLNESLSQRAILILPEADDPTKTLESRTLIKEELVDSALFHRVEDGSGIELLQERATFYKPYRYQLLSADDRRAIQQDRDAFLEQAIVQRSGLFNFSQGSNILEDPVLTFQNWLSLLEMSSNLRIDSHGFIARNGDQNYRVILLQLQQSPFTQSYQAKVMKALLSAQQRASAQNPDITIIHSGLLFHAYHASQQAQTEISTIGLGSMLGAVVLLLLAFRSGKPICLSIGAIAFGFLGALATCLLIFDDIHLITLAFGASLIGVSIDYSFHYFSSQQKNSEALLQRIRPALLLALSSSVLAYLALTLTPFPGLQQMGVFSAAGLAVSCLTVLAIYPLFSPIPSRTALGFFQSVKQSSRPALPITLSTVGVLLLLGAMVTPWEFEDDVRLLNNSPEQLLHNEKLSQTLIGGFDSSRYLIFQGESWQSILEEQETVQRRAEELIDNGQLGGIQLLSQHIPSNHQQALTRVFLEERIFNEANLTSYFDKLGIPSEAATQSMALFLENEDVQLNWKQWSQSATAQSMSHLWVQDTSSNKAAIALLAQPIDASALQALNSDSIRYVDKVSDISNLMQEYRQEISLLLGLSYGLALLVLHMRFKRQAFAIILVPLLSTLCAFGLMSALGASLNIFSVLASLLVLGIGLDMGIVLRESSHSEYAWQTISLSAGTTMLAFGLLSLSETPVLYHFGLTILLGITFNWFFSWLLSSKQHCRESIS